MKQNCALKAKIEHLSYTQSKIQTQNDHARDLVEKYFFKLEISDELRLKIQ